DFELKKGAEPKDKGIVSRSLKSRITTRKEGALSPLSLPLVTDVHLKQ
ncbi:unnamed protein product, partial [Gulo gulo]